MRAFFSVLATTGLLLGAGCVSSGGSVTSESLPNSSTAAHVAADTSTWKPYINVPCGLSLKYPSDAVFLSDGESGFTITSQNDYDFQQQQEGEAPSAYYVSVSCKDLKTIFTENDSGLNGDAPAPTLESFFEANTNPLIRKIGSATVGGKAAFAVTEGAGESYSLWVPRGKQVDIFDFSYTTTTADDLSPIQEAILASIAFAE